MVCVVPLSPIAARRGGASRGPVARGGVLGSIALAAAAVLFPVAASESVVSLGEDASLARAGLAAAGGGMENPFFEGSGSSRKAPRIALVFDDLGYTTEGLARELLEMRGPLTFAVLPGLPRSVAFAKAARARGHEVILHLPMEPFDTEHHDPGEGALLVDLDPSENLRRLRRHLGGLPFYSGVSNHMGSRFTSRPASMELVLGEIRRHGRRSGEGLGAGGALFFLDSRTTSLSVVPEKAHCLGVPCLASDLFLDGSPEAPAVPMRQAERLCAIARRRGWAIGIGHVKPATVEAVREELAAWREGGVRLVGLSDLLHPQPLIGATR